MQYSAIAGVLIPSFSHSRPPTWWNPVKASKLAFFQEIFRTQFRYASNYAFLIFGLTASVSFRVEKVVRKTSYTMRQKYGKSMQATSSI